MCDYEKDVILFIYNSIIIIISVTSREEHEHSHRHLKTAVEKLSVPGEQSSLPRTASPKTPDMHPRNRSRTPSSSYHRVPENASRSLSPPDLRYLLLWLCAFLPLSGNTSKYMHCKQIRISMSYNILEYLIFQQLSLCGFDLDHFWIYIITYIPCAWLLTTF